MRREPCFQCDLDIPHVCYHGDPNAHWGLNDGAVEALEAAARYLSSAEKQTPTRSLPAALKPSRAREPMRDFSRSRSRQSGATKKRGRPVRSGEAATVRVTVRLTRSELHEIRALIGRGPLSNWMRDVALRAVRKSSR